MKRICPKCGYFKETQRGMILCNDCRQKLYEEQKPQKQGTEQMAEKKISKKTSKEELKVELE